MHLAVERLYRARWTNEIHEEWIENLSLQRPDIPRAKHERTKAQMNEHIPDSLVTGYELLIPGLHLPDPGDRHVFAAAIVGKADVIVTYNTSDFPNEILAGYGIEAQAPDVFLSRLLEYDQESFCKAFNDQGRALKNPSRSIDERLSHFAEKLALPVCSVRLRNALRQGDNPGR